MSTCIDCGDDLPPGRRERCEECARKRRKATLQARRRGSDLNGYNGQAPVQPFTLPPGCHLLYARCKGCEPGEGVPLLGWGDKVVARQYPDLKPGEVNLVLR